MSDANHSDPFRRLVYFVVERESVRVKKELGFPQASWTKDEILQTYRFCNVRREDDRVTRWIADNWRTPHAYDPDLWAAMVIARLVNYPDSLAEIGYPVPWRHARFLRVLNARRAAQKTFLGVAYRTGRGGPKSELFADMMDTMWNQRKTMRPTLADTLCSYHMTLGACYGLGSFLAAQVVADLKYVWPLRGAKDWMTFAASGPGSRRGLNRLLDSPVDLRWSEDNWRFRLADLKARLNNTLRWDKPLHAQDVQNCLCEFDKYERVRTGEGRPKQRFRPHGGEQ